MGIDDPYDAYAKYKSAFPNLKCSKVGILNVWNMRLQQYIKDPIGTWKSEDPNKIDWTVQDIIDDPIGMIVGRSWPSEEEIEAQLIENDKHFIADSIKKSSDYYRILPNQTANGVDLPRRSAFLKTLTMDTMYNNIQRNVEIEGETRYEKRLVWDINTLLHFGTMGWYKYDPYESRSAVPGMIGYGNGIPKKDEPKVIGPNIRGRYARDLRGDNNLPDEFTNESDYSNRGSDNYGV